MWGASMSLGGAALALRRLQREGSLAPGARTCRRQRHFLARPPLSFGRRGIASPRAGVEPATLANDARVALSRRDPLASLGVWRRRGKRPLLTATTTARALDIRQFLEYEWKPRATERLTPRPEAVHTPVAAADVDRVLRDRRG